MANEYEKKGLLEEIQSLNEKNKKRVLVIGTAIIMIIVIGVWITYFNGIIASAGQQSVADGSTNAATTQGTVAAAQPTAPIAHGSSIWQNVENGMASIGNIFKRPSNYTIQPQ
jgi:hypothetical protein